MSLHRARFVGGIEVVVRLRDFAVPVEITATLALCLGEPIAALSGAPLTWRTVPILRARRFDEDPLTISPELTPAGASAMAAVPTVGGPNLSLAILAKLVPSLAPPP